MVQGRSDLATGKGFTLSFTDILNPNNLAPNFNLGFWTAFFDTMNCSLRQCSQLCVLARIPMLHSILRRSNIALAYVLLKDG